MITKEVRIVNECSALTVYKIVGEDYYEVRMYNREEDHSVTGTFVQAELERFIRSLQDTF